ncbi:hypothetical protein F4604DRAFT_1816814 [Suillus subluteus]|nr:hypothetical protein F4604DRAFT_1816814 [Suillus subluteus]
MMHTRVFHPTFFLTLVLYICCVSLSDEFYLAKDKSLRISHKSCSSTLFLVFIVLCVVLPL